MNKSLVIGLKRKPMVGMMVRVPQETREKVKALAKRHKLNESDILRAAVITFVDGGSTDSREESREDHDQE